MLSFQTNFKQLKTVSPSIPVCMFEINWGKLFTSSLQCIGVDAAHKMPEEQMRQHESVRRFQQLSLVPPAEQKIVYDLTKQYMKSVTIPSLPSLIDSSVLSVSSAYLAYSQKLIWHAYSQTEPFYGGHSIKILQEMNYRIVSDPGYGDLVVYFYGQPKSARHTALTKHTIDSVSAIDGRN